MKRLLLLNLILNLSLIVSAQKKPAAPAMPNITALQKMKPAELEAYKQKLQKQLSGQMKTTAAAAASVKMTEPPLPDFELQPPPKDLARLALIPKNPPTLIQLADGLRQSKKNLEAVTPKPILDEAKKITETQTPAQQHTTAVAVFMADKPAQALLTSMYSTLASPEHPATWNNLAAMFNMTGLEHKAIPILMNQLQQEPDNPTLLNNLGQAYMGLGDMISAEHYFAQCLAVDPSHLEANRSMGMIRFFEKRFDEGTKYFEKELEAAYRRSTMALLKKHGRSINLYNLRKKAGRVPGKKYVEEIELAKFQLPSLPMTTDEVKKAVNEAEGPLKSIAGELAFWSRVSLEDDPAARQREGARPPGVYGELTDELL